MMGIFLNQLRLAYKIYDFFFYFLLSLLIGDYGKSNTVYSILGFSTVFQQIFTRINLFLLLKSAFIKRGLPFFRAGIAQSVSRWARARRSEFDSRQGQNFPRLHSIQTDFGTHPASYPVRTEDPFRGTI
jgi:hypothetical protein